MSHDPLLAAEKRAAAGRSTAKRPTPGPHSWLGSLVSGAVGEDRRGQIPFDVRCPNEKTPEQSAFRGRGEC